ncbi:MAG: hypothetical protein BWK76_09830 [Desulfobulbaceae bacterium A2]|nr:MAG: hypothetical protein BWK76_09830 [Desulfobulbaceae bacterium A2]
MNITFLGVGEACDPAHGNTSLVVSTSGVSLLIDCGFSVPHRYFALQRSADQLDACYISHFHGDHVFGLPLLLLRLAEMGRSKPLLLLGPAGMAKHAARLLDLAYPGFAARLPFEREYLEMVPGTPLDALGLTWQTVLSEHSQPNLCLRLDDVHHSLGYSGDGRPVAACDELYDGVSLLVHEAFSLHDRLPNHGSVASCLELARRCQVGRLALVHLGRETRASEQAAIQAMIAPWKGQVLLPADGDILTL